MNNEKLGQIYAILAFFILGAISPIYFKQVASFEPIVVLIHRIFWSFLLLIPLLYITNQIIVLKTIIKDSKKIKYLAISTFFISINWLVFIWQFQIIKLMET